MGTKPNIVLDDSDWIDVATVSGVTASNYEIQNVSESGYGQSNRALVFQSAVKPLAASEDGHVLFPPSFGSVSVIVVDNSETVWMRAKRGTVEISVSE